MNIRVLHIELGRHLYGGAKQVTYLVHALDKDSAYQQHLLCTEDSEISKVSFNRCTTHTIRYRGDTDLMGFKRMLNKVKQISPDIIHVHTRRGADIWGALAAKLTGIPAICTRRVDNPESRFAYYKYRQYDAVISISEGVQKVVAVHCEGVKHQRVIHSAVDKNEYSKPPHRQWLNEKFDIPPGHFVIANFAQYIPRKGQADLILAMRDVVKKHKNVTCLLFGKGALKESYQSLIDRHELQHNVKLCGFTNEVARILPNIDAVVHPAYAEGLGVILLQAGMSKCAVISSPVGGIPEIIKHKETGLMVAPGDIGGIVESIEYLLSHPETLKVFSDALHHHVVNTFSIESMTKAYSALYNHIVKAQVQKQ